MKPRPPSLPRTPASPHADTVPGDKDRPIPGPLPTRPLIAEDEPRGAPVDRKLLVPVLRVVAGRDVLRFVTLPLGVEVHVGRDPACELPLTDPTVSRRHARIVASADGEISVVDLETMNGTRVNGQPVERSRLRPGDAIEFGSVAVRLDQLTQDELRHINAVLARLDGDGFDRGTGLLEPRWLVEELPGTLLRARQSGTERVGALFIVDDLTHLADRSGDKPVAGARASAAARTRTPSPPAPARERSAGRAEAEAAAIRVFSRLVLLSVRDTDMCVRYGERSVLVLLDANAELAGRVAARVRKVMNSHDWGRIASHLRLHVTSHVVAQSAEESTDAWLDRLRLLATPLAP